MTAPKASTTATQPIRLEVTAPATVARKPARWDGERVVAACGAVGFGAPVWVVWSGEADPWCEPGGRRHTDGGCPRCAARAAAGVLRAAGYGAVGVERDGGNGVRQSC